MKVMLMETVCKPLTSAVIKVRTLLYGEKSYFFELLLNVCLSLLNF